jgi:hypothetical protein
VTEDGSTPAESVFDGWLAARRALDRALDEFMNERGSTRELFLRVAELRRSEEVAWAAVQEQVGPAAGS